MATQQADQGLAINAKAIMEAVSEAVDELLDGQPEYYRELVKAAAVECVSDEMDHAEKMIPINKILEDRMSALAAQVPEDDL